ncbi:MAG: hypothetical protein ACYCZQ_11655 [Burkholderiales bacterium]
MYEKRHEPLIPPRAFLRRVLRSALLSAVIVVLALGLGVAGYHFTEHLSWLDSLLNASMILGGMGPVDTLRTVAGKLFASFYALFSGLVFIGAASVLLAPLVHRLMHHFHIEEP